MNLELKHMAPYLPYGLKCMYADGLVFEIDGLVHLFNEIHANSKNSAYPLYTFKPILRPLSDLTKEIEVNGERFVPIDKLGFHPCPFTHNLIIQRIKDQSIKFGQAQMLFEWHFDVFGLISSGLAIDINTLEP